MNWGLTEIGYAFSFGIFQDYYSVHEPFRGSGNIAVIGTCAMVSNTFQRYMQLETVLTELGYCIFNCSISYCGHDTSAPCCSLGIDHGCGDHVSLPGTQLILYQCDTSYFVARSWIWRRRMPGIYSLNSFHVGVVLQAKGSCFWDCMGKWCRISVSSWTGPLILSTRLARAYLA